MGKRDVETECRGFFSKKLDLLLAVSLFVVLSAFIDVLLTVLQHSIDQSGEPVSHGRDGFRGTELGAQASVLRAEVSLASQ